MDLRTLVIIIAICIQCSQGLFVPSGKRDFRKNAPTAPVATDYTDLLHDLAVIKLKLESLSMGPVYLEGPYNKPLRAKSSDVADDTPMQFNEMAMLELIPVIIEQKRKGNVSPDEEMTLKEIFGDLWIVIEEEVSRTQDEEMNPILKALLQSNNDNRLKRALVQHHRHQQQQLKDQQKQHDQDYHEDSTGLEVEETNDIIGNSVDRVRVTRWPKSFVEVNPDQLTPQQRLMRHAAFQIRQWFDLNAPKQPTANARGSLKRNRKQMRKTKKQKRKMNRRKNKGRRNGRKRQQPQNFQRPKRHNTEIYVDDNHGYFDYDDFEDSSFEMTKPHARSIRHFVDEYDSAEEEELDYDQE